MNEAVTQHVTMGVLTGDYETVDPDSRSDADTRYYSLRKVLAGVVDGSEGLVQVKSFTRSHFEDTDANYPVFEERRQLVREMRSAYGPGALRKLDHLLTVAEGLDMESQSAHDQLVDLLGRIKPPYTDAEGRHVPGSIDISNL